MRTPNRSLVVLAVAVVLVAAVMPGMAGLMDALVEPTWILVAVVRSELPGPPEPSLSRPRLFPPSPADLRAPPAPVL